MSDDELIRKAIILGGICQADEEPSQALIYEAGIHLEYLRTPHALAERISPRPSLTKPVENVRGHCTNCQVTTEIWWHGFFQRWLCNVCAGRAVSYGLDSDQFKAMQPPKH